MPSGKVHLDAAAFAVSNLAQRPPDGVIEVAISGSAQARAEIASLARETARDYPESNQDLVPDVVTYQEQANGPQAPLMYWSLLGAAVFVRMPGATAEEVEQQVASRLERLLHQIDGVEYVYSMSRPGEAVVTVRFYVGENREASLVKLHNKILMNTDAVPPGVTGWVVKPVEIDDVPLVNVTLWSATADDFARHLEAGV